MGPFLGYHPANITWALEKLGRQLSKLAKSDTNAKHLFIVGRGFEIQHSMTNPEHYPVFPKNRKTEA